MRFVFWLAGWLGYLVFNRIYDSLAIRVSGDNRVQGKIVGIYHQQFLLFSVWCVHIGLSKKNGGKICIMVSDHRDGEYLNQIIQRLGGVTVRGDSRRKPIAGLKAILKKVDEGYTTVFAVDGPVGPAREFKPGIVMAALMTGKPIAMVFTSAQKKWVFASAWDRFFIPKFFSPARIHVAPDFYPDREKSLEENLSALTAFSEAEEKKILF